MQGWLPPPGHQARASPSLLSGRSSQGEASAFWSGQRRACGGCLRLPGGHQRSAGPIAISRCETRPPAPLLRARGPWHAAPASRGARSRRHRCPAVSLAGHVTAVSLPAPPAGQGASQPPGRVASGPAAPQPATSTPCRCGALSGAPASPGGAAWTAAARPTGGWRSPTSSLLRLVTVTVPWPSAPRPVDQALLGCCFEPRLREKAERAHPPAAAWRPGRPRGAP